MAAMFSMRVVTTDHYLADPIPGLDVTLSEFRGTEVKKVPILRIFGSTPAGQKTCMHIHGVFPYLYVPYDGTDPWDRYLRQFAASLDKAINIASNNSSNPQHVHKLSLVTGIPMYGYHDKEQEFIKIYLYNPSSIRKAADLLLAGAVMSKPFQPYEAHIPYQLQLFIDFNLYGMNLINAAAVKFRRKRNGKEKVKSVTTTSTSFTTSPGDGGGNKLSMMKWNDDTIPVDLYLPESVERQSSSELEVDIVAADILNRLDVDSNIGANPGLAALWEDERQRRRDLGEDSHITPPESQDHSAVTSSESEKHHLQRLHEIIEQLRPYIDSQSEPSDADTSQGETTQADVPATPASVVDFHQSQSTDSMMSQDTLENDDDDAVVSLETIQRVMSFSQSFSQPSSENSVTEALAALAQESSPVSSQLTSSQLSALEEKDSVIADIIPDDDLLQKDDEETLEMSQRVWDAGNDDDDDEEGVDEVEKATEPGTSAAVEHDLEGMDDTWESPLEVDEDVDPMDDNVIPQLDGASDKKPESSRQKKRAQGTITHRELEGSSYQGSNPYRGAYTAPAPAPVQPLASTDPGFGQPWNHDVQSPPILGSSVQRTSSIHGSQQQHYQNWQHNAWHQQTGVSESRVRHDSFQSFYNHPQSSTESNYRYPSSYSSLHDQFSSPESPRYDIHSHYDAARFPGSQNLAPQDSYQHMMQYGNRSMTNASQYGSSSFISSDNSSSQCSTTTTMMNLANNPDGSLMTETEPFDQLVNTLSSPPPLPHPDLTTTVTDLDTMETCISPPCSRTMSGLSSSQQDLFSSPPPQKADKHRSLSLDESSHSECLMDLSDCRGYLPKHYKSDNVCSDLDMSSSFSHSPLTMNKQTHYPSSAMSGLYNLVSNISHDTMYEVKNKDVGERRSALKLSLKRSRSMSSTASENNMQCSGGWIIQTDPKTSLTSSTSETIMPVSTKRSLTRAFTRTASHQPDKPKIGRPRNKTRSRSKSTGSQSGTKQSTYTYAFHVPTPVFKRLKFHQKNIPDKVKVVRMHPKDARKYSLLKIGREVVEVEKMSVKDILKYTKTHQDTKDFGNNFSLTEKQNEQSVSSVMSSFHYSPVAKIFSDGSSSSSSSIASGSDIGSCSSGVKKQEREYLSSPLSCSSGSFTDYASHLTKTHTSDSPSKTSGSVIAALLMSSDENIPQHSVFKSQPAFRNTTPGSKNEASNVDQKMKYVDSAKDDFTDYIKRTAASLEIAEKPSKLEQVMEKTIEAIANPVQIGSESRMETESVPVSSSPEKTGMKRSDSFSAAFEQFIMSAKPPERGYVEETTSKMSKDENSKNVDKCVTEADDSLNKTNVTGESLFGTCTDDSGCCETNGNKSIKPKNLSDTKSELLSLQAVNKDHIPVEKTTSEKTSSFPISSETLKDCQDDSNCCNETFCGASHDSKLNTYSGQDVLSKETHDLDDPVHSHVHDEVSLSPWIPNQDVSVSGCTSYSFTQPQSQTSFTQEKLSSDVPCSGTKASVIFNLKTSSYKSGSAECTDSIHCGENNSNSSSGSDVSEQEDVPVSYSPENSQDVLGLDRSQKKHGPVRQLDEFKHSDNAVDIVIGSGKVGSQGEVLNMSQDEGSNSACGVNQNKTSKLDSEFGESEKEPLSEAESTMSNARSRTSSRTSSRKESSDSNECMFEDVFSKQSYGKKQITKSVDTVSECSDSNVDLHDMYFDSYTSEIRRKRTAANYSPNAFAHLFKVNKHSESKPPVKKVSTRGKRKKNKQKLIPGVHYIIIGKFKGYKSMGVRLQKLKMDVGETVNVCDYLEKHREEKEYMRKAQLNELQNFGDQSVALIENHLSDDNSLHEMMDEHSLEAVDGEEFVSRSLNNPVETLDQNSLDCSSALTSESDCQEVNSACDIMKDAGGASSSYLLEHQVVKEGSHTDVFDDQTAESDNKSLSFTNKRLKTDEDFKTKESSFTQNASSEEMDTNIEKFSALTNKEASKKNDRHKDLGRVELTTTIDKKIFPSSYQTAEKIEMFSRDVESDSALATGSTSFMCGDHSECFDSSNSNDSSSNFSCFKTKSDSQQDSSTQKDSNHTNGSSDSKHGKKTLKKKLTPNQKLGVAFLSTRRKKKGNKEGGKLMNSLSLLHQATIESLVDKSSELISDSSMASDVSKTSGKGDNSGRMVFSDENHRNNSTDLFETTKSFGEISRSAAYTDNADDYDASFEDTMYKLALFSPPLSDPGDESPPVPLSPVDLAKCSSKTPPQLSNSSAKSGCAAFKKNGIQNNVESIYETPLSSVENQKDISEFRSLRSTDCSEVLASLRNTGNENDFLKSKPEVVTPPSKTAVVKLSPLLLSDISNINAQRKETSSKLSAMDTKRSDSSENHDAKEKESNIAENDISLKDIKQKPDTCDDGSNLSPRENLESSLSEKDAHSYSKKTGSSTDLNWTPVTDCIQSDQLFDPYINPIKDPQYEDISSDEDGNSDPADADGGGGKTKANTSSKTPTPSQPSSSTVQMDTATGEHEPAPQDDAQRSAPRGNRSVGSTGGAGKIVICPRVPPPSRDLVCLTAAAHGLGTVQNKKAFCSNPADMPENRRLLDGPQSRLQSALVKDLPEFKSSSSGTLLSWRQRFVANNRIFSSQTNIEPLWEKLQKDPEFKYVLSEDRHCVLTPCRPPPCKKKVLSWLRDRELSQKIVVKNTENNDMTKIKSKSKNVSEFGADKAKDKSAVEMDVSGDETNFVKNKESSALSLFESSVDADDSSTLVDAAEESVEAARESSVVDKTSRDVSKSKPEEMSEKDETECGKKSETSDSQDKPCVQIIHMKGSLSSGDLSTGLKKQLSPTSINRSGKSRWDQLSSQTKPGDESVLHSTPLRPRRSSSVLFEPSCSPIDPERDRRRNKRKCESARKIDSQRSSSEEEPVSVTTDPDSVPALKTEPTKVMRQPVFKTNAAHSKTAQRLSTSKTNSVSQIEGPTPRNTCGFKFTQLKMQNAKALHEYQYLTVLSVELHMETRGDLRPDPEVDPIQVLFYSILNDIPRESGPREITGLLVVDKVSAQQDDVPRVIPTPPQSDPAGHLSSSRPSSSSAAASSSVTSPKKTGQSSSSAAPSAASSTVTSPTNTGQSSSAASSTVMSPTKTGQSSSSSSSSSSKKVVPTLFQKSGIEEKNVCYVSSEQELIEKFIYLIAQWDPDILVGYEIQMLSWGYVIERASHLGVNLIKKISRIPDSKDSSCFHRQTDEWGAKYSSEIHVPGRIVLNLWRIVRHEVNLNVYTFENVAFHILHQRLPMYSYRNLTMWFVNRLHHNRWRVVEYYLTRVKGNIEVINQLDVIGKTSEFARVFGIQFYDVLSRGSQFRVESMMLRLAKPMNFIPVSPSVQQRARQKAGECIPLTLEPESQFYTDPVVVLDFQSLYPSIMIAYNYCFSTCLGRLESLASAQDGPFQFGCTSLSIKPSLLKKLEKDVTVSPNGVVFLKQHVRRGVLPRMVEEILNTRLMVKKSLKAYKSDKVLRRLLDARQLGLKLIANVTYGYTGASFSGRMPCIEVGDSIVRKARESLELSIKLVENTPDWRARVVYGDTDSMFILLKGRSKDEAFVIGQEIADAVTNMFPKPMKLKFEKVYLPCVLQTKKRYVGFMYETPDQKEPVYDAKGIETVRRDNCAAVAKILERSIKLLFTSRDVSLVKSYVQRQCNKLMEGKVSIQDCVFAKEYRGTTGYKPGACVPALEIARKLIRQDKRAEPRVGERVPYVIVYGSPGLPLIQLVRQPMELLRDPALRINGVYYITKQILPPLSRMFSLLGIDVFAWYQEIPRIIRFVPQSIMGTDNKKGTISQYFATTNCPVCDDQSKQPICPKCMSNPQMTAVTLMEMSRSSARVYDRMSQICYTCMGCQDSSQPCVSVDCSVLFRRFLAQNDKNQAEYHRQVLEKALDF